MDALAHGWREQDLIFNRRPGVDSIVEVFPLLADGADEHELQLLGTLLNRLSEHNVAQLRVERDVLGWANGLAVDLHAMEISGAVLELGVREVAALLRAPLARLLEDGLGVFDVADAVRAIDTVLTTAPRAQIFGPSLENLLGGRKYRLLEQLDDRRRGGATTC